MPGNQRHGGYGSICRTKPAEKNNRVKKPCFLNAMFRKQGFCFFEIAFKKGIPGSLHPNAFGICYVINIRHIPHTMFLKDGNIIEINAVCG